MAYDTQIREEELKNKLRQDYFKAYDSTPILGDIDFAVAVPVEAGQREETEYLLWAESKKGTQADIYESFVQLILTIGKARTIDHHLPPAFLGAFDAEKIAFVPFNTVLDVFYQNDFNWKVAPSDHTTKEFRQLLSLVKASIDNDLMLYSFGADDRELHRFIRQNFIVGKSRLTKIRINKNNFTAIYQKWLAEVKPTIGVDWNAAKEEGLIDADFYLADILSEHNVSLKEKLFVLLRCDRYIYNIKRRATGSLVYEMVEFDDGQKAHHHFWNRYYRPPRQEYWDYIVNRRDLLVPQDVRERKGSFFTPAIWVEKSQEYLAAELGEDWQDEYYVWDCAAGTGNLLANLTNKYNVWASTLDQADVEVMRDRISNGANLLDSHVFQFDFLNDPFTKLPKKLQDIIADPEKRRKLIIYINPPYADVANARTSAGTGTNRAGLGDTAVRRHHPELGRAGSELFAQFFVRIVCEIRGCGLAEFSKLKILQGPNYKDFRRKFPALLRRLFLVPANTFDNVKGQFPIGFQIWDTSVPCEFEEIKADVYATEGKEVVYKGEKTISAYKGCKYIIDWLRNYYDKAGPQIGYLRLMCTDFQNNNGQFLTLKPSANDFKKVHITNVSKNNVREVAVYFAVRHCIEATWMNDRDQFLYPNEGWESDKEFQTDCLAFTLFHGQNRVSAMHGVNHWIPFTEEEVGAQDKFGSHFMHDYLSGRFRPHPLRSVQPGLFAEEPVPEADTPLRFSSEAQAVFDAGRELWRYYHAQPAANPDAAFYDIRLHFQGSKTTKDGKLQMNSDSSDLRYTALLKALREKQKSLAKKIEPKVYEYGFLKK